MILLMMRRVYIILLVYIMLSMSCPVHAYWIWTSESGKWENPKHAAKDTPEEQLEQAVSFYEKKNYKFGLREFKKLIKYYPLSKQAPTAQYYIGRIMQDLDKTYEAYKAYQKVIDLYPYTDLVDEVIEREYKIGVSFFEGKKLKILGPLAVPAKDKAVEILKTVAENAPYGKFAEPAIFKSGLAYKDIADYNNAILMFKDIIDKYPNGSFLNQARYQLAECSKLMSLKADYDQTPTEVARKEFEDFIEKNPDDDLSDEAREIVYKLKYKEAEGAYNTGQFYESRRKKDSAIVYYEDVIDNYPDTEWAKKAQERLNEITKK